MVWVETPSNPLLNVVDIRSAADAAHAVGATARRRQHVRDAVPPAAARARRRRRRPLDDEVPRRPLRRRSAASSPRTTTRSPSACCFLQKSLGAVPGPFDSWLVLRGIKTLAVRMRQHCENARAIAEFLDGHEAVERVLYPGLPRTRATRSRDAQMRDFGGMVSFLAAVRGGGGRAGRAHEALPARRVARRRREPDRASRRG